MASAMDDMNAATVKYLTPALTNSTFRVNAMKFFADYSKQYMIGDVVRLNCSKYPHRIEERHEKGYWMHARPIGPRRPRVRLIDYWDIRERDDFLTAVHKRRNP